MTAVVVKHFLEIIKLEYLRVHREVLKQSFPRPLQAAVVWKTALKKSIFICTSAPSERPCTKRGSSGSGGDDGVLGVSGGGPAGSVLDAVSLREEFNVSTLLICGNVRD